MGDNYKSCSTCTMEMSKEKREGSTWDVWRND
jgi:hypothetical protein